jgi:hypothetical protein
METTLQRKSHLCISFLGLRGLSPNFHIHVSVSDLYIFQDRSTYLAAAKNRQILEIYKFLTDI